MAQIFHIRLTRKVSSVSHIQISQGLWSCPVVFSSYCILFVAQLWQHKALIYSEAFGGVCRARARRAITLTSNCRQMQPRDGDHKSVSDEPQHSQLICIHPPAGLLSESISTGAETTAAEAGGMSETLTRRRCSVSGIKSGALWVRFASSYGKLMCLGQNVNCLARGGHDHWLRGLVGNGIWVSVFDLMLPLWNQNLSFEFSYISLVWKLNFHFQLRFFDRTTKAIG